MKSQGFGKTRTAPSCISCPCNASCAIPKRYLIACLLFPGFAIMYAMRVNISVAIAVMVANHTILRDGKTVEEPAEFKWSTKDQGLILGAFYFGYLLMQLPGGILARRFGGATVLGLSIGCSGIGTMFTPLAARLHVAALIALRIVIGLSEGVVYPAGHAFWSDWAPPLERTKLATVNVAGARTGVIISMLLSGHVAFTLGWPSIFYVFGLCGILWSFIWFCLVRNSPSEQPCITMTELVYIESSQAEDRQRKDMCVPWKAIFASLPFWAIVVANFTEGWSLYLMLSELPLYFTQRLHFSILKSAFASSLPYAVAAVIILLGAQLADCLRKKYLETGTVRKIFNTFASLSYAVFVIAAGYTVDGHVATVFITLGVGLGALASCGFMVNHLDIAPPFASVLFGLTNTAGTLAGVIVPVLTGIIVEHHTVAEWKTVFFITGAICVFGSIFYLMFASGEKQTWAQDSEYQRISEEDFVDIDQN